MESTITVLKGLIWSKALRDYERQKKAGLDPVFDPLPLGIKNADLWRERLVPPAPRGE
ncbi:hypothetical protein [Xanthomonas graminis]|uniref:Uncharacterized protein n=1 Tax=Xanthomonas graminis pv. arrhenatheri LMG 727 TaxID=1195923 RepID=A0A0K2ZPH0_9XANT|nr:hypothetical protein [Xanthomonas translucens]UKE79674.1 hypothetical protein KM317_14665 [Xanthomonas translucens pv. arrhenatheri]CTP87706.1 hypothetical protein XTALMG727_2118 [Xanthomonas translucens pv. arrhenatheri LMG 727]